MTGFVRDRWLSWLVVAVTVISVACAPSLVTPTASREQAESPVVASTTPGGVPVTGEPLVLLAASDLQYALPEIASRYEAETGRKVTISLGSTGNIAAQIENGAPADIFFAADGSFLDRLGKKDLLDEKTRQVYATGRIVVTYAKGTAVEVKTIEDLASPEVKKVAIANPEHAPYGRAAQQALEAKGLWSLIKPKIVLGENVSQTFQFIHTGNADAGIIALSIAQGQPNTPYTLIDDGLHAPLVQEVAVLRVSRQPDAAKEFLAFVNGSRGRPVMKQFGFVLPGE